MHVACTSRRIQYLEIQETFISPFECAIDSCESWGFLAAHQQDIGIAVRTVTDFFDVNAGLRSQRGERAGG
jgi:hypothetical protein